MSVICAQDHHGKMHQLLIRDVRRGPCVPSFTETLLSVDQIWDEARAEARFADVRSIMMPTKSGKIIRFPFRRADDGLNPKATF